MLNDTALVPSEVVAMYPPADVTIPLLVFFDTMDDGGSFLFHMVCTWVLILSVVDVVLVVLVLVVGDV